MKILDRWLLRSSDLHLWSAHTSASSSLPHCWVSQCWLWWLVQDQRQCRYWFFLVDWENYCLLDPRWTLQRKRANKTIFFSASMSTWPLLSVPASIAFSVEHKRRYCATCPQNSIIYLIIIIINSLITITILFIFICFKFSYLLGHLSAVLSFKVCLGQKIARAKG